MKRSTEQRNRTRTNGLIRTGVPFDGSKFAGSAPCSSLIIVLHKKVFFGQPGVNSMIEEIIVSCDGSGGSASIGDEESSQYSGLIAWGGGGWHPSAAPSAPPTKAAFLCEI